MSGTLTLSTQIAGTDKSAEARLLSSTWHPVKPLVPGLPLPYSVPNGQRSQLQELSDLRHQVELLYKLRLVTNAVEQKFGLSNIAVLQAWIAIVNYPRGSTAVEVSLFAEQSLVLTGDAAFTSFRNLSCQSPLFYRGSHTNGMPGRVWRTGSVQIIQNIKIIPPTLHPRNRLSEEDIKKVAEVLYIPVYDAARSRGPVAVLEVFLSSHATDSMLVANLISYVGAVLTSLQLSLANPTPQPMRRPALTGKRTRLANASGDNLSASESDGGSLDSDNGPCQGKKANLTRAKSQVSLSSVTVAGSGRE